MQPIPMVRAGALAPYLAFFRKVGVRLEPLLVEAKLPAAAETDPEILVPFQQGTRFLDRVARREGIEDLGIRAGELARIDRLGAWGRGLVRSLTLHEALDRAVRTAHEFTSAARYGVVGRPHDVLFWHRLDERIDVGREHVLPFAVMAMIELARQAGGDAFRPKEVRIEGAVAPQLRSIDALADARITSDSRVTAIAIPRALLGAALGRSARRGAAPDPEPRGGRPSAAPAQEFMDSLKQALAPLVCEGAADLESAAEIAGLSVRTLQRRLADAGSSFSRLVDEVRFDLATRWLSDPDIRLIDIAYALGYSDPAHFTRAFRRWTGTAPHAFRLQRAEPGAGDELRALRRSGPVGRALVHAPAEALESGPSLRRHASGQPDSPLGSREIGALGEA